MFSAPRFFRYLRWLWLRSPSWYLAAPIGATVIFGVLFYFSIGPNEGDFHNLVPHFDFQSIGPWIICSVIFGSIFTAIHFASRHLANDEEAVGFLSLPVSTFERWLGNVLGLGVAIPLFTFFSICLVYLLLTLFRGVIPYPFPDFASIWPLIGMALLAYLVFAPMALAIGVLKPKRAIVWYVLVGILLSILFPILVTSMPTEQVLIDIPTGAEPANLVGLDFHRSYTENIVAFAMGNKVGYLVPAIVCTLAFLSVHFIGLRHKQA